MILEKGRERIEDELSGQPEVQVALLEALASGCYCLSHCWMGAKEVLPVEHLYVTDDELIAKIMGYAELPDSDKRKRQLLMRQIASEKFNVARQKEKIREIIEDVLKVSARPFAAAVSATQPCRPAPGSLGHTDRVAP